nr:hypothetical protein GTC16762_31140 [Pigmentibacter ruber]
MVTPRKNKQIENRKERERINLSFSFKDFDELKVILINRKRYELKINERQTLSGPGLLKYLIAKGLKDLNKKYGEIDYILRKEKLLNEK